MHREGVDSNSMQMSDILCDFCEQPWTDDRPMVEGHRGACICGHCLTVAFAEVVLARVSDEPAPGEACVLCREGGRPEQHWRSPATEAVVCRRCVKQSAGVLHKDHDIAWTKPKDDDT